MKRILVLSDSHGTRETVLKIIDAVSSFDVIFHCGDGWHDIDGIAESKEHIAVWGNTDTDKSGMGMRIYETQGVRFFITHGHQYTINYGDRFLIRAALTHNAHCICYGHTHIQDNQCFSKIHLFNPGSVLDNNYGIIEIGNNAKMTCTLKHLDK